MNKEEAGEKKWPEHVKTIGHVLSQRRQDLQYDISDIVFKLKLTPAQIEALESDNRDFFPGRIYYQGFLKAYADFLEVDLESFDSEKSSDKDKKSEIMRTASPGKKSAFLPELTPLPGTSKRTIPFWIFFVSGVALTALAYTGWYQVTRPPNQASLPELEKLEEANLEPPIPPAPLPPEKSSKFEPRPITEDVARQGSEKTSKKTVSQGVAPVQTLGQKAAKLPSSKGKRIVLLALKPDTFVDITNKEGQPVFSKRLKKNEEWVSPSASEAYFLSVNDASAVSVKTKSGAWKKLGKNGLLLRNFDLSSFNGN